MVILVPFLLSWLEKRRDEMVNSVSHLRIMGKHRKLIEKASENISDYAAKWFHKSLCNLELVQLSLTQLENGRTGVKQVFADGSITTYNTTSVDCNCNF